MFRILVAGDFHGSTLVFRKLINAGIIYKTNAIIITGDLIGKVLVLIVKRQDNTYEAEFINTKFIAKNENELEKIKSTIENRGYYYTIVDNYEYATLSNSKDRLYEIMSNQAAERLQRWLEHAINIIKKNNIKLYIMGGNDDWQEVVKKIIEDYEDRDTIINIHDKEFALDNGMQGFGLPYSNKTPWNLPGDLTEDELNRKIEEHTRNLKNIQDSLFVIHVPPKDTPIDEAPLLNKDLKIRTDIAGIQTTHVGSTAVREAILKYQPIFTLHGHIHESRGVTKLGRTYCFNAGSEYEQGILRAVIINMEDDKSKKIKSYLFFSG
jgi:Icc-related predicted phosphoesterase